MIDADLRGRHILWAQRGPDWAWSAGCARCVFNERLQMTTLGIDAGAPPGGVRAGLLESRVNGWRAVVRVLRSPAGAAQTLLHDVVTTIFPANCRACDGPLDRASLVPVCPACVRCVLPEALPGCSICGEAVSLDLDLEDLRFAGLLAEGMRCRECRLAPPAFERAVAYAAYEDQLRTLIHLLKYEHVPQVARLLGGRLAETVLSLHGHAGNDLLVIAVPLFKARERQRGYNQAVLLADAALGRIRRIRPEWRLERGHRMLVRKRRTESQYVLSKRSRRRNLRGAFAVTGDVRGREVLLIDDVLTSGATARECARVLVLAGATKVWVATLARAQKRFVRRQHEDPGEYVAAWDLPVKTAPV